VVASVAFHFAMVGVAVVSLPVYVNDQLTDGIIYFAPLPTQRTERASERITYVDAPGTGDIDASAGATGLFSDGPESAPGQGGTAVDDGSGTTGLAALAELPEVNVDSVYFPDEVDNPAAYDPRSAAPAYPDSLQAAGIEGSVIAQFIVDTTGRAADSSLIILDATHPRFAQSVREAMPRMLFRPAELSGVRIRQLVQQMFTFRLPSRPGASDGDASTTRPPTIPPHITPPGELSPVALLQPWLDAPYPVRGCLGVAVPA
jgi:TonB family protein